MGETGARRLTPASVTGSPPERAHAAWVRRAPDTGGRRSCPRRSPVPIFDPGAYRRRGGLDMTALGFALLLIGAIRVVAEAHVPGVLLGVSGGAALIAGGIIVISALGG